MLKAYGAEVVVCPTAVAPEHPDSYYNVSDRLASQPGAWKPDQYSNPHNPRSHYETTGPEIWAQTEGRITHFVTGMGTGGTISGVGSLPQGAEPRRPGHRRRPGRLGLLRRHRPPLPRRGRRRGLLARDLRPRRRRPRHRGLRRRLLRLHPSPGPRGGACWSAARRGMAAFAARQLAHELAAEGRTDAVDRGAAARLRPRLPDQDLQRRLARPVRLRDRRAGRPPHGRRGAARQVRPAARPGPHPPRRDDRRGRPHPPGVRRQPDAGRACRAADRGRGGRGVGVGADAARRAVHRHRQADRPGRGPHVGRAADRRLDRAGRRRGRRCWRRPTPCWCTRTASPSAC